MYIHTQLKKLSDEWKKRKKKHDMASAYRIIYYYVIYKVHLVHFVPVQYLRCQKVPFILKICWKFSFSFFSIKRIVTSVLNECLYKKKLSLTSFELLCQEMRCQRNHTVSDRKKQEYETFLSPLHHAFFSSFLFIHVHIFSLPSFFQMCFSLFN